MLSARPDRPYGRWSLKQDALLRAEVQAMLLRTKPLQHVSPDLLSAVLEEGLLIHIPAGKYLIREGSREVDIMYVLIEGAIEILVGGRRIVLHDEPGETVGEMSTISRLPRIADVRTQAESTLVEIPVQPIFALRTTHPERYINYLELIALQLGTKLANATRHERQYAEELLDTQNIRANNDELQRLVHDKLREVVLLSHVFRGSQDAILIADPKGVMISANPTALAWFGWEGTELGTISIFSRFPELDGMQERLLDPVSGGFKTGLDIGGTIHGDMPVELTFTPVVQEGRVIALAFFLRDIREHRGLLRSLQESQDQLIEYSKGLEQKVAERTSELRLSNVELKDINGRLRQETERKDTAMQKLKETQSQLLQSEKMVGLGHLAAGVAHEINNPIGYVGSNLHTLKEYVSQMRELLNLYGEVDAAAERGEAVPAGLLARTGRLKQEMDYGFVMVDSGQIVADAEDGVKRVAAIVRNLKEFTHLEGAQKQFSDLNESLESTIKLIWNELKYKATVVREYGEIPKVECYPNQLNQAFLNLLMNAVQAIEKQGTITVGTGLDSAGVQIRISDDGCGIAAEALPHIFEPFFTTKPVGTGMGLGLTSAYGIVTNHHGRIEVVSKPGAGAAFTIHLPVRQPATTAPRGKP